MEDGGRGGDMERGERANGEAGNGKARRRVGRSNQSAGVTPTQTVTCEYSQTRTYEYSQTTDSAADRLFRRRRASEGLTHRAAVGAVATSGRAVATSGRVGAAERRE